MKRIFCLALTVLMLMSITVIAGAAEETGGDIIVLYTNDVHCATEDYALLAAYRAKLISEGHTVYTVDAGDAIQGEMIGSLTEGAAIVDIMNNVGYDFAIPGNHEFDYMIPNLLSLAEAAEYEYLCSNFRYLPEEKDIFAPFATVEAEGKTVAFVGISTPETYSKSTPTYFQDENGNFIYSFLEDDFYETVQTAVDAAIAAGADTVIAIGHLGIAGVTEGWRSVDLIANVKGIDAFLDAHAHEVIEGDTYKDAEGEDVVLSSTGTKFDNIGMLTVSADGSISTQLIDTDTLSLESLGEDAKAAYDKVKAVVDGYNAKFEYLYEEIGRSEVYLTENDENGNWIIRCGETNLGNFVTDAYIAVTGADIAFVNGGGVRAEIHEGAVTRKAIMDINPWGNEMCVLEVTGTQLLDALEYGVMMMPEVFGSFPHVAGISFEVHTYVESPVTVNENGDFVSIPDGAERRVANVKVGGEALAADKVYTIAGTRYMLQLSGYKMFADAKDISENLVPDNEMLVEYLTDHLNGVIPADKYGKLSGEGRMTVISQKPTEESTPSTPPLGDGESYILWIGLLTLAGACAFELKSKQRCR